MKNKAKMLFISGSPRKGNTDFVLSRICDAVENSEKEIIFLRDKKIGFCKGCLACHNLPRCVIRDSMKGMMEKMLEADILVIGTPNYFDNVSALMKNFIDRCHPFYKSQSISRKKVVLVYVGGGKVEGTKKYLDTSFFGFIEYLKLDLIGSYAFQALERSELSTKENISEVDKIVEKINALL
ncbi:MAG: NADPH-dependent FMN reductase [uncultured bacterium]|nr:MAG: NADPH-dependent FMN reductase [uncultured bacterium]